MVFLVKAKTELLVCIKKLSTFCKIYGKLPKILRSHPAKVEVSNEVREQCAAVNGVGIPGIRVAAPEQHNQNTVKRYMQATDNKINAIIIDKIFFQQHNGMYLTYLPEHGHFYVAPRYNIKQINLGPDAELSVQDGQKITTVMENGK
jgi:hypothetical protein